MANDIFTTGDDVAAGANERVAPQVGNGVAATAAMPDVLAGTLSDGDVVDILNDLIETCLDGEIGFRACAGHADALELKNVFQKRSADCSHAATDLRVHVLRLGGEPKESGTTAGALHRGWLAVRSTLTGYGDHALLDECETGEDHALGAYRKALKQALPTDIHTLVERQMDGVQRNQEQIRALREKYTALA